MKLKEWYVYLRMSKAGRERFVTVLKAACLLGKTRTDYSDLHSGMAEKKPAASAVSRLASVACDFPAAGSQISTAVRKVKTEVENSPSLLISH